MKLLNKYFFPMVLILVLSLSGQITWASEIVNCNPQKDFQFDRELEKLSGVLGKTTLKDGYFLTSYNLKIEADCKGRMPIADLEKFYRTTMSEGTQCLGRLNQYGNLGNQNNACLLKLFADKSNPPKILCGGWPFGNDIWAVGSFPGSSKRHPYLWLSPNVTELYKKDPREMKATVFHEMLHNCGFTHSEGIEVAYTCEECCFGKDLSESKKASACKICGGKYANEFDINYQKDLINWSKDYKGWGRDMRQAIFIAASKTKNTESYNLLLDQITNALDERAQLMKIFNTLDVEQKKNLIDKFEQNFASSISGNEKLQQLLKWTKS